MRPQDWPQGVDRIIDHGDHWHLYRNGKEILVVRENPREIYPRADIFKKKMNLAILLLIIVLKNRHLRTISPKKNNELVLTFRT